MDNMYELNLEELETVTGGVGLGSGMVEADGTVIGPSGPGTYQVNVGGQTIAAHVSGKLRMNFIKISPSDRVRVEYFPNEHRGRITWRY